MPNVQLIDTQNPSATNGDNYLAKGDAKQWVGQAVVNLLRSHFLEINQARTHGYTQLGWYEDAAYRTTFETPDAETVRVTVKDKPGMNLHYYGGTVVPKNVNWLTIPAFAHLASTYNTPARNIPGLKFVPLTKKGGSPLAALMDGSKSVWYWLVKSTHHNPDPSILPNLDDVASAAMNVARTYYLAFLKKGILDAGAGI